MTNNINDSLTNYGYDYVSSEQMENAGKVWLENNPDHDRFNKKQMNISEDKWVYFKNKIYKKGFIRKHNSNKELVGTYKIKASDFDELLKDPVIKEILDEVEKNTYPYDEKIQGAEIMWYGKHHFFGLHIDGPWMSVNENCVSYISSTLIYASEDLKGGELVLGGTIGSHYKEQSFTDFIHKLGRHLQIVNLEKPGDFTYWNSEMLHGVSQIESGERITLITTKLSNDPSSSAQ